MHTESVTIPRNHRPSMYRASAREIVLSADQALTELARFTHVPRRQGVIPSPSAAPSARP